MVDINFNWNDDIVDDYIESFEEAQGMLFYPSDHALFVEVDTEYDSLPPEEPIREWVIRNILEGTITASEEELNELDSIVWAVRKSIQENGTEGIYYLTTARENMKTDWENIAAEYEDSNDTEAPVKIVEQMLEDIQEDANNTIEEEDKIDTGELIEDNYILMGVYEPE